MSSRNVLLTPADRSKAAGIQQALQAAKARIQDGEKDARKIEAGLRSALGTAGVSAIDYASVVDPDTLAPLVRIEGPALLAVAAFYGPVRLIDNLRA
jgi:pantoate--beta-alanine ligase